jgi:hypothetical protein
VKCFGDGVALHRVVSETKSDRNEYGKSYSPRFGTNAVKYVVCGAATEVSVSIVNFEKLSQGRFDEGRRSAEKCNNPHPKNGSGATEHNGGSNSGKIAGADTAGNRDHECLKRTNAVFVSAL